MTRVLASASDSTDGAAVIPAHGSRPAALLRRVGVGVVIASLLAGAVVLQDARPASAEPTETVDRSFAGTNTTFITDLEAQQFTPTISGDITAVTITPSVAVVNPTIEIRPTDSSGLPTDTVIATGALSSSLGAQKVALTPAHVDAGTTYVITIDLRGGGEVVGGSRTTASAVGAAAYYLNNGVWTIEGTSASPYGISFTEYVKPSPTVPLIGVTRTPGLVNYHWTAVAASGSAPTAESYAYRYRITGAADWTTGSTTTTSFSITDADVDLHAYEAQVRSVNGTVASNWSTLAPSAAPSRPVLTPRIVAGLRSITASASQASGTAATSYQFGIRAQGDTDFTVVAAQSTASHVFSGLTAGTNYQIEARGTSAAGYVGDWATSTYALAYAEPGQVMDVAADVTGTNAVISWTAPATYGKAVTYTVALTSPGLPATSITSSGTSVSLTGLAAGAVYTATVTATTSAGTGATSDPVAFTAYAAPSTVAGIGVTERGTSADVSWNAATANGAPITAYHVTLTSADAATVAQDVDGTTTTTTIDDLVPGAVYSLTVTATNKGGTSPASAPVTVRPYAVPSTVTGVTADVTGTSADIAWDAADARGRTITRYRVELVAAGQPTVIVDVDGATTSTSVTGLTPGAVYSLTVTATNSAGDSDTSTPIDVRPYAVPFAPTSVSATAGVDSATISFGGADPRGSAITAYRVTLAAPGHPTVTGTADGSVTSLVVSGLAPDVVYSVTVAAQNAAGFGAESTSTATVRPYDVPFAPTDVSAVAGDESAAVSWTAASDNGSTVTAYHLTLTADGQPTVTKDVAGDVAATIVTGLVPTAVYTVLVAAENAAGEGAESDAATVTPYGVPGAPTEVVAASGRLSAAVSWTAPAGNGSPITSYRVVLTARGHATVTTDVDAPATATTVTGLDADAAYTVTVFATNAAGEGSPSDAVTVTPYDVPDAPTDVVATADGDVVHASWTAPADHGAPITHYVVLLTSTGHADEERDATDTSLDILGLEPGREYTLTVFAVNAAGSSEASAPVTVTPFAEPLAPTGVTATPGDGTLAVAWVAASARGSEVTGYEVTYATADASTTVSADSMSVALTGLTNGTDYTVTVRALSAAGPSASSDAVDATPFTASTAVFTPAAGTTLHRGDAVSVQLAALPVGAAVAFELHSTPVVLATATVDATGSVTLAGTIPTDAPFGAHDLVVTVTSQGVVSTASSAVTLAAAATSGGGSGTGGGSGSGTGSGTGGASGTGADDAASGSTTTTGSLAYTGLDLVWPVGAAALLLLAGLGVLIGRRRRA